MQTVPGRRRAIVLALLGVLLHARPGAAEDLTLCRQGWQATQSQDHAAAIRLFEACIAKGNLSRASLARTHRNLGIAHRRAGEFRAAIQEFDQSLALEPSDPWNDLVNRGNCWSGLGDYDAALADYDRALAARPGYDEAFYNRGIVFEKMGRTDAAIQEFRHAYARGLRSEGLLERLDHHRALERSSRPEPALPPPPEGYVWVRTPETLGALLKPAKWHFKKVHEGDTWGYFVSKEDIDTAGHYTTGLLMNVIPAVTEKTGMLPSAYAKRFVREAAGSRKVVKEPWRRAMGPFDAYGVVVEESDAQKGDFVSHHLVIANDATGTLYVVVFEAPARSWDAAWRIGEPILAKLWIDSEI